MKKSIAFISAVAIALPALLQSCNIDNFSTEITSRFTPQEGEKITLTASLEGSDTKTQMTEDFKVVWTTGDQIRVFNSSNTSGAVFTLDASSDGKSTGSFTGSISGNGPYYAVYPASAGSTLSGTTVNLTIPATQAYSSGSFPEEANIAVAYSDNKDNLNFKNVCGILCLSLESSNSYSINKIKITTDAEESLNGSASVAMTYGSGTPSLSMGTPSGQENKSITLTTSGIALSSTPVKFFIAVPAGTLASGYTVEMFDSYDCCMIQHAQANTKNEIVRSAITTMPALSYRAEYNSEIQNNKYGIYLNVKAGSSSSTAAQYGNGGQYALSRSGDVCSFRIQNWEAGYAVQFTGIPADAKAGDEFSLNVTVMGNVSGYSPTSPVSAKVIKKESNTLWIVDESDNCYVLTLE